MKTTDLKPKDTRDVRGFETTDFNKKGALCKLFMLLRYFDWHAGNEMRNGLLLCRKIFFSISNEKSLKILWFRQVFLTKVNIHPMFLWLFCSSECCWFCYHVCPFSQLSFMCWLTLVVHDLSRSSCLSANNFTGLLIQPDSTNNYNRGNDKHKVTSTLTVRHLSSYSLFVD